MINFDSLTLNAFLQENIEFLQNSRIQKIQQPSRKELILNIRNLGENRKLYININPQHYHLCFISKQNEARRGIAIPKSPVMFCMQLRKYLEGAKIVKVNQPEFERILEFYFEAYSELDEKIHICLAIELMGKHSNIVLYNYDTNVIIGVAHNIGAEKSREREMAGGLPYVYPSRNFIDVSKLTTFYSEVVKIQEGSVSSIIDNYYSAIQEEGLIKSLKSKLLTLTNKQLKKVDTAIMKQKLQLEKASKGEVYRKNGDLIMANLFNLKDFTPSAEVFDYAINSPCSIELDATKTLKDNANRFYKLYNKMKITKQKAQEFIEGFEQEAKYLHQVVYSINAAANLLELKEIEDEISPSKTLKPVKQLKDNIATQKIGEFDVFIGKNNKQNDYIITKLADDEDLWFHTKDYAGSHVLLKTKGHFTIPDEVYLECCRIAKENSAAQLSSKIGVVYTRRKYIKKPPKAQLGYVIYRNEYEIVVD